MKIIHPVLLILDLPTQMTYTYHHIDTRFAYTYTYQLEPSWSAYDPARHLAHSDEKLTPINI